MKQSLHARLKWALSTSAAIGTSLFVLVLENQR
jgi:hypothetical protein